MKFKGTVKILGGLQSFKSFSAQIDKALDQANAIAAVEIRNEAIALLADNSDGTIQTRYLPKRKVHVSAPGDPPNSDFGRLQQSIKFERDGRAYLVGTNLRYGAWLEFGTTSMAARPWLSVAVRNVKKLLPAIFEKAYDNVVKGLKK